MSPSAWVQIGGVFGQLLIGAFFFGATYQKIMSLGKDGARVEKRVDTIELRLNDHTERIARLEGRDSKEDS